jgi:integrase
MAEERCLPGQGAPDRGRNGQAAGGAQVQPAWSRDWLIGLVIYRHGLRVSEACDLRWDDIDLPKRTIIVRRLKGSTDSVHYLERDEVNGLKLLQRQQRADRIKGAYVFINERGQPFTELYWTHDGTRWRGCALPFLKPNASPFWGVPIA